MSMMHSAGSSCHESGHLGEANRRRLGEAAPIDQFHAEEGDAVVVADFVNRDNMGMVEGRGGLRFAAETVQLGARRHACAEEHLQRYDAIQAPLAGAIDDAHTAAGDFTEQFVIAELVGQFLIEYGFRGSSL
jgi:hypothetical protein